MSCTAQWDPDHTPSGGKCGRRAIQLGLRKEWAFQFAGGENILKIADVTAFVALQRQFASSPETWADLRVPIERPYRHPGAASQAGRAPACTGMPVDASDSTLSVSGGGGVALA